jgi:uncharacterized Zn-binding protein involved in type VI secretion
MDVEIEGKPGARKLDLTDHGAVIGEGCDSVVMGGALPAARLYDRFRCPDSDLEPVLGVLVDTPHVGGFIIGPCAASVLIGGRPAARVTDVTLCVGPSDDDAAFDGLGGAGSGLAGAAADATCAALWQKYQEEAEAIIRPVDGDHRKRNHVITGAYADLYLRNRKFKWAGLAGYASKQVGCAMDHAQRNASVPGAGPMAVYTYEMLGSGNRELFLDIYPLHRFYEEHGYDRMQECANERVPPIPAAALDGFRALDKYEKTGDSRWLDEHVRATAFHEQVNILQAEIYNDEAMKVILDVNEGNVGSADGPAVELGPLGAKQADVVMSSECSDPSGKKTLSFESRDRRHLYNVDQRMDWILNDVAGYYNGIEGTPEHRRDAQILRERGQRHGGRYP